MKIIGVPPSVSNTIQFGHLRPSEPFVHGGDTLSNRIKEQKVWMKLANPHNVAVCLSTGQTMEMKSEEVVVAVKAHLQVELHHQ